MGAHIALFMFNFWVKTNITLDTRTELWTRLMSLPSTSHWLPILLLMSAMLV